MTAPGRRATVGVMRWVLSLLLLLVLAPAATAATTRFATSDGSGTSCTRVAPCSLLTAVDGAAAGDTVLVGDGAHRVRERLDGPSDLVILPWGGARPVVRSSAPDLALSVSGGRIEDLVIEHDGERGAFALLAASGSTLRRLRVTANAPEGVALVLRAAVVRETLAVASGPDGIAADLRSGATTLEHVTALATGTGGTGLRSFSGAFIGTGGGCEARRSATDLRNSIVHGAGRDLGVFEIRACEAAPLAATVEARASNLRLASPGSALAVTDAGGNQSSPELTDQARIFVEPGTGRHQRPTSPTVDAGTAPATALGSVDLDGEPRLVGAATDMGADELPAGPGAVTEAATDVMGTTATLRGTATPPAYATRAWFEWGTTDAYGNRTPDVELAAGGAPQALTAGLAGLAPGTTFHARLVVAGTVQGAERVARGGDVAFTTAPAAPAPEGGSPTTSAPGTEAPATGATATPSLPAPAAAPRSRRLTKAQLARLLPSARRCLARSAVIRLTLPRGLAPRSVVLRSGRRSRTLRGRALRRPVRLPLAGRRPSVSATVTLGDGTVQKVTRRFRVCRR